MSYRIISGTFVQKSGIMTNLHVAFRSMPDPRIERKKLHDLPDIIILSIFAVPSGAESYDSIELFGKENIDFLKRFLSLKNGIPSHDTINRVFQTLNPRLFEECFVNWAKCLKDECIKERMIAIDGKTIRGSRDGFHGESPLHSVRAWSVENGIRSGRIECAEKSNEIVAIPQILDVLDIEGSIITVDAPGTQTKIARKIVENGGDYILAVKGNQGGLQEEVETTRARNRPISDTVTVEKGRGRIETRRCEVFEKGCIADFDDRRAELKTVIKITAAHETGEKVETATRLYVSGLTTENNYDKLIRDHWAVENNLHWVLDMVFREDERRKRANHAAKNFALVRKIALNPLKRDTSKYSLRSKRLGAGWSKDYIVELLKF